MPVSGAWAARAARGEERRPVAVLRRSDGGHPEAWLGAIELWLARNLTQRGQELDHGEFLEVLTVPFAEALAMTRDGRVTDVKTVVGLYWAELVLR